MVSLPFSALHVSKWNRSFEAKPDDEYLDELAKDISRNRLIHPITVVASKKGGEPDAILAGANRFWALRKARGENSGLMEGEYVVRADITEDNPHCLDISLSENGHRRQSSVIETARYVERLLQQEKVDQKALAPKLHIRREAVNRLSKLARCFGQLPETWQKDLSRSPSKEDSDAPTITLSHWVEVAAAIGKDGDADVNVADTVKELLDRAARDRWSSRDLRKALRKAAGSDASTDTADQASGEVGDDDSPDTAPAQQTATPRQMVEKALKAIQAAAEAVKAAMPDAAKLLLKAAKQVQGVLENMGGDEAKTGTKSQDKTQKVA